MPIEPSNTFTTATTAVEGGKDLEKFLSYLVLIIQPYHKILYN
jgi:hypothetical protein